MKRERPARTRAKRPVARSTRTQGAPLQGHELETEVDARNRELTEALEQQKATGEILRVLSGSPTDAQPVFDTIARSTKQLCAAEFCLVFRFDGRLLHFVAHAGLTAAGAEATVRAFSTPPDRGSAAGRAILDGAVAHVPDVEIDPHYALGAVARVITFRSVVAVPMLRDRVPVGAIAVARSQAGPFPERQIELLRTFADQAVIGIENVRLFNALQIKNADLTEALEQQTATSEILRVISSSPTDVQPVFEAIVRSAQALIAGDTSAVFVLHGDRVDVAAADGVLPDAVAAWRAQYPRQVTPDTVTGRAILERQAVQAGDLQTDPEYEHAPGRVMGVRTTGGS